MLCCMHIPCFEIGLSTPLYVSCFDGLHLSVVCYILYVPCHFLFSTFFLVFRLLIGVESSSKVCGQKDEPLLLIIILGIYI